MRCIVLLVAVLGGCALGSASRVVDPVVYEVETSDEFQGTIAMGPLVLNVRGKIKVLVEGRDLYEVADGVRIRRLSDGRKEEEEEEGPEQPGDDRRVPGVPSDG